MGFESEPYIEPQPRQRCRGSETFEPTPRASRIQTMSRDRGSETVKVYASRSSARRKSVVPDEPRLVEEAHASYMQIQRLITELSGKYGIAVRSAPQVASGRQSSPRPSFFE